MQFLFLCSQQLTPRKRKGKGEKTDHKGEGRKVYVSCFSPPCFWGSRAENNCGIFAEGEVSTDLGSKVGTVAEREAHET